MATGTKRDEKEKPKYRSSFEEKVANALPPWYEYEKHRYNYIVPRRYTADFVDKNDNGYDTVIEVKGYFRVGDTAKYKAIRKSNPDLRLIFIFSNPNKKIRKGAKMTMAQWAEKEGWEWYTLETIDEI